MKTKSNSKFIMTAENRELHRHETLATINNITKTIKYLNDKTFQIRNLTTASPVISRSRNRNLVIAKYNSQKISKENKTHNRSRLKNKANKQFGPQKLLNGYLGAHFITYLLLSFIEYFSFHH